ncbi:MAG: hypothetical protein SVE93_03510 [Candidatus Thermoplasmatota archaeon]|nr:hypothetical protein [Candidatus Thermoplasmatota archaeon]
MNDEEEEIIKCTNGLCGWEESIEEAGLDDVYIDKNGIYLGVIGENVELLRCSRCRYPAILKKEEMKE